MRRLRFVLAAALLALVLGVVVERTNAVLNPACASLTPDDTFLWWWYECGKDSTGGGGSGAGD